MISAERWRRSYRLTVLQEKIIMSLLCPLRSFTLFETGRLLASAAINRQESRAAHQRIDFPDQDARGPISQYIEKGLSRPIHTFSPRQEQEGDVVLHLRSGDAMEIFQLYGSKGENRVGGAANTGWSGRSRLLHYSGHNCERGLCGNCRMRINGRLALACLRRITEKEITLEKV